MHFHKELTSRRRYTNKLNKKGKYRKCCFSFPFFLVVLCTLALNIVETGNIFAAMRQREDCVQFGREHRHGNCRLVANTNLSTFSFSGTANIFKDCSIFGSTLQLVFKSLDMLYNIILFFIV